jgi:hypothetical protein
MFSQGSFGSGVSKLQSDLNKLYPRDLPQLRPDGVFGPKTKEWVMKFQRNNPPLKPDGIAGPKTLAKLQVLAGGGTLAPGMPTIPPPPTPPTAGTGVDLFRSEMQQEFLKRGKPPTEFDAFLKDLENDTIPGWKVFLGTLGRVEDARQIASFWIELNHMLRGVEDQRKIVLAGIAKLNKNDLAIFEALAKPTGKLGKAAAFAGSVASAAGLVVTGIECILHARKGDYGAVAAEIYKFAMGKAVPWAAMIEGIGSLLDGVVPENTRKNSYAFKIIRSIDPIGLGGTAVDSVCTLVKGGVEVFSSKNVNESALDTMTRNLTPLVARMKQGPTSIFVELGENSGDALYELTQTEIDWNAMARYTWSELSDWVGNLGS